MLRRVGNSIHLFRPRGIIRHNSVKEESATQSTIKREENTRRVGQVHSWFEEKRFGFITGHLQNLFFYKTALKDHPTGDPSKHAKLEYVEIAGRKGPAADEIRECVYVNPLMKVFVETNNGHKFDSTAEVRIIRMKQSIGTTLPLPLLCLVVIILQSGEFWTLSDFEYSYNSKSAALFLRNTHDDEHTETSDSKCKVCGNNGSSCKCTNCHQYPKIDFVKIQFLAPSKPAKKDYESILAALQSCNIPEVKYLSKNISLNELMNSAEVSPATIDEPDLSKILNAGMSLLSHQLTAVAWMGGVEKSKSAGGILADEMGMGKTDALVAHVYLKLREDQEKRREHKDLLGTLIVCKIATIDKWVQTLSRSSLDLSICKYDTKTSANTDPNQIKTADVVITTYEMVKKDEMSVITDQILLKRLKWTRVVLDDAHTIHDQTTQVFQSVSEIDSKYRWALTGTPIQNNIDDLLALLYFLRVDSNNTFMTLTVVKKLLSRVLLRRTKGTKDEIGDAVLNLPPKHEMLHKVILKPKVAHAYNLLENQLRVLIGSKLSPIVQFNYLRRFCTDPQLLLSCADRVLGENPNSIDAPFWKSLKASSVKSAKISALVGELKRLRVEDASQKIVVFVELIDMLDILHKQLLKQGFNTVIMKSSNRAKAIKEFEEIADATILLAVLRSGGDGFNLTVANHVFILDIWYNPALVQRACDKLHRIGQTKPVVVHRFMVKNTIEERVYNIQQKKEYIARTVLKSQSWTKEMMEELVEELKMKQDGDKQGRFA